MTHFFQRRWKLLAKLVLVLLALGLIASWIAGGVLCAPANHPVIAPTELAVEPITFSSVNGATIHGWLVAPPTNHGVVILQHGVRGDRNQMVSRARFLSRAGYAALLYDFQAHGESAGTKITFGFLESRDAQAAVAFVKNRFPGQPVAVIGVSLGAAAAVLATPPLDVNALVLESMYPTIIEATKNRIEIRFGPAGRLLSPLLTSQIQMRTDCSPEDLRPIFRVAGITTPKLFLAGTADRDTKFSEAQAIFAQAAEPKTFVPFEDARHVDLHVFAPDRYEKLILDYLEKHLK